MGVYRGYIGIMVKNMATIGIIGYMDIVPLK